MRFFLLLSLLIIPMLMPGMAWAEYSTIEELVRAYDDEPCRACHSNIHDEWHESRHAQALVSSLGVFREFVETGVERDWKRDVRKEDLMRCMDCHAPQLKDASESLVKEVVRLALAATDTKDTASMEAARNTLSRVSVNCVVCHNTKASLEKNLKGPPLSGVYYGPFGKPTPDHGTARSTAITSPLFCGQCHGPYAAGDGEIAFCTSLYESHQDHYRANGGLEKCQDCHMRAKGRGHRTPGGHDIDMLRDGIAFETSALGIRQYPGRWVPAAVVSVNIGTRAGHRTPDG